ncbi:Protein JSN1 [Cyberlindnera fabianii]|uniref:Protein JSN1 n=1 Tax=Cyberlindnera fabianii TaxID=36022 RepID=A0A1V2L8U5_CYBFA|nr:Protein JSN1 [Cyberlindnera fabianii]
MSFSGQDNQSFLQVPGSDSQDQASFLSISPQRSGSPHSILSEQIANQQISNSATSNIGSFRTRSRAGTLPSRLYPNNVAPAIPGNTQAYSPSYNGSSRNSFDPNLLNFEALSIATTATSVMDQPTVSPAPKTRLRSGSLFGISDPNSIWSSDGSSSTLPISQSQQPQHQQQSVQPPQPLQQMSINSSGTDVFHQGRISPPKQTGFLDENQSRARSYTTNHAPLNEQYYLQKFPQDDTSSYNQAAEQLNSLGAIPEMVNVRPRAQTFEGGSSNGTHPISIFQSQNQINKLPEHQMALKPSLNEPLLIDNIDPRLLNWTSTYQDSSLGPTNTLILSNLPPHQVVQQSHNHSQQQPNHQLLSPNILPQQRDQPPSVMSQIAEPQPRLHTQQQQAQQQQKHLSAPQQVTTPPDIQVHEAPSQDSVDIPATISDTPPLLRDVHPDIRRYVEQMGIHESSGAIDTILNEALKYDGHDTELGPLPAPLVMRQFDAPKLRETRKMIDANLMSALEIEELSVAMLDELPELSSDYLGNTVVQKLFEYSCTGIKHIMLKEVSPYLAQMGVHKNGTWSAQKMISVADTPLQKDAVAKSLKPYCAPLFNDQFGNYVIQCSLKFGAPWNDFIFEAILAKFWLIAQNRYGARAVRACLESPDITPEQTALISSAIVLHAEHLAINQNAALLITWFLDTCTLPNRHILLAPRLIPHLAQLCTHKLASLTILKILNNRNETEAKTMILNALFGPVSNEDSKAPDVLFQILQDNTHGASLVYKVLSNPQLEPEVRKHISNQVRGVLLDMNASSYQGYKRLMDEVGLSNRGDSHRHTRNHSNGGSSRAKRNNKSPQSSYNTNNMGNSRRSTPNGGNRQNNPHIQQNQPHITMTTAAVAAAAAAAASAAPPSQSAAQTHLNEFLDYHPQQQIMYQSGPPQAAPNYLAQHQQEMFPFEQGHPQAQMGNTGYPMQGVNTQYGYGAAQY